MFDNLVKEMNNELRFSQEDRLVNKMTVPKWLSNG